MTHGELFDENAAAGYLKLSPRTLQSWRARGIGPAIIKLGRAVRYSRVDLDAFIDRARDTFTEPQP